MLITEKNLQNSAQDADKARHAHETGEILSLKKQIDNYKRLLDIETKCKNHAYFFILESGYLKQYEEYNKTHSDKVDYHSVCVDVFRLESLKNKQNGK